MDINLEVVSFFFRNTIKAWIKCLTYIHIRTIMPTKNKRLQRKLSVFLPSIFVSFLSSLKCIMPIVLLLIGQNLIPLF